MPGTLTLNFAGIPVNCPPISRQKMSTSSKFRFTPRNSAQTASFRPAHPAVERKKAGSLYDVLNLERTASMTDIKMAYRSLAKMHHPDAVGSAADGRDFMEIHNAYATLSDPAARAIYDLSLEVRARGVGSRVYPTRKWETDQCW